MNINPQSSLPVVEEFYTLQGEGHFSGHAAYFIRIGGCDVGCEWCDTKVSWNPLKHPNKQIRELVFNASSCKASFAVITGGEPLMYNLGLLCEEMNKAGVKLALETSGAYQLSGKWEWICLSPKKNKPPVNEIFAQANELKIVIANENDLHWAIENSKQVSKSCELYLQPEWSVFRTISPKIIEFVKQNPQWRISLQTHKFLRIP